MLLKYGNLMLPAGHILDLHRVRLSNAAPFWEIVQSFISMQNTKFLVPFSQKKKCPFWPISNTALDFQNMPWPGAFSNKVNPWYWFYRWSSSSVLCFNRKNTLVGADNLQMIRSKFWFEYLWEPYVIVLDPILCIAFVSWEYEEYNLRSWLREKELTC